MLKLQAEFTARFRHSDPQGACDPQPLTDPVWNNPLNKRIRSGGGGRGKRAMDYVRVYPDCRSKINEYKSAWAPPAVPSIPTPPPPLHEKSLNKIDYIIYRTID